MATKTQSFSAIYFNKDYLESRLYLEEAEKGGGEAAAKDDGEDGDQGGRCQKDLIRGSHKELLTSVVFVQVINFSAFSILSLKLSQSRKS